MFSRIVSMKIREGSRADFLDAVARSAATSLRDEPGCLRFDICADRVDPYRFFLYQLYIDDEAAEAHRFTEHFLELTAAAERYVEPGTHIDYSTDVLFSG
ncbi:putative quinol monooxygenase [Nocardia altamirensis]|uniref:putative quinol monooxygenase n=1 Tax=Nocardia altamirensis TaxID=472158 RepID=UPI0008406DC1|nr:antibiotic biosynthesis monooxygenase [Nocardia altamirensis]